MPARVYAKIFASSYLIKKRIRAPHFLDLIDFLTWERWEREPDTDVEIITVHTLDEDLRFHLKNVAEKLGFVFLARDEFRRTSKQKGVRGGGIIEKYHWYNFIIYSKATLDSVAVTLNENFKWGFQRGEIDFRKARFCTKLNTIESFSSFLKEYASQINHLVDYRDAIEHQKSIDPVGGKIPNRPLSIKEEEDLWYSFSNIRARARAKVLRRINLNSLFNQTLDMLLVLLEITAETLLIDLENRFPKHRFSRVSLG